jgi:hypothetical protein
MNEQVYDQEADESISPGIFIEADSLEEAELQLMAQGIDPQEMELLFTDCPEALS